MSSRALHVERVRRALLDLPASGVSSFEDLIAHVFTDLFGRPFRLSASGTQNGCDGATVDDGPMVAFEAKLHDRSTLDINKLRGKIAELSDNPNRPCSLWMLVTTKEIKVQADHALRIDLARTNTRYYAFDWCSGMSLPKVFVLFLLQRNAAIAWFRRFHPALADTIEEALNGWELSPDDSSVIAQTERDLTALIWDADTVARTFAAASATVGSEFEASMIEICLQSIEFVKLGPTKHYNEVPKAIISLRSLLTATATYRHYFGALDEDDAISALRAVDHQTAEFVAAWGDVDQAPDMRMLIEGVRRQHGDVLSKISSVPGDSARPGSYKLYLSSSYEEAFLEQLEDVVRDLAILGQSIDALVPSKSTRDNLRKLIYKISMHIMGKPIDLIVISDLINRIDLELDNVEEDLSNLGRRIIGGCRRAFGKLIKHRLLPDLTTFQLPGLVHDFILFDRPVAGATRLVFALSRFPVSEQNIAQSGPMDEIILGDTKLGDEPILFSADMLDSLVARVVGLSETTGLSIGLPADCHHQCFVDSREFLPTSDTVADEQPILTDVDPQTDASPRVARLYLVPWLGHITGPKPHDFDYYR